MLMWLQSEGLPHQHIQDDSLPTGCSTRLSFRMSTCGLSNLKVLRLSFYRVAYFLQLKLPRMLLMGFAFQNSIHGEQSLKTVFLQLQSQTWWQSTFLSQLEGDMWRLILSTSAAYVNSKPPSNHLIKGILQETSIRILSLPSASSIIFSTMCLEQLSWTSQQHKLKNIFSLVERQEKIWGLRIWQKF